MDSSHLEQPIRLRTREERAAYMQGFKAGADEAFKAVEKAVAHEARDEIASFVTIMESGDDE